MAYNRRFYASVIQAESMIAEDGGPTGMRFEFTEFSKQIEKLKKDPKVMSHWILGNSSHILDLAFFLGGFPSENWRGWTEGSLDWHAKAARFCGAGITRTGTTFSYFADWEAPGRWGLEITTKKRRLIFRPIEKLAVMEHGKTASEQVEVDDRLDQDFKPGLYLQTQAFIEGRFERFCSLEEQAKNVRIYEKIAGYRNG